MVPTIHRSMNGNLTDVTVGTVTYWFSYETCVAFQDGSGPRVVSENVWSSTTGKHLNYIDGHRRERRVPHAEFTRLLEGLG